jgi:hypothetical protein
MNKFLHCEVICCVHFMYYGISLGNIVGMY